MKKIVCALVAASLSAGAFVVACTDEDSKAPAATADGGVVDTDASLPATDASSNVDADAPAPDASLPTTCAPFVGPFPADAGAQCHDVVSNAPSIAVTVDPGTLPTGTGGTLGDGLYYLTEARIYPGSPIPSNTTLKYAVLVAGEMSYVVDDNGGTTVRRTTKRNPDGGAGIILCETKVDNNPSASTQTATCNSLITYDSTSKFSAKFAKQ